MTKPKQPWRCQKCGCNGVHIPRAHPRSKICAWCARDLEKDGLRWCSKGRHGSADWTPNGAMCRACQRTQNQAYRAEHYEEAIQYSRDYHAAHREEMVAASRAYYQANREALLEQKREYYQANRETIKAKVRAFRPHRKPASIARERARHQSKRGVYKANERAAALRRKAALWRQMLGREEAA